MFWKKDPKAKLEKAIERAVKSGALKPRTAELLRAVLRAEETPVEEIMVPRVDVVTAKASDTVAKVVADYKEHGFTKVVVISDDGKEVIGVLHIKEVIRFVDDWERKTAGAIAVQPIFIPHTKTVLESLDLLRHEKASMALVVDEFGSWVGIVTTEDLLEELVGEIQEEYDREEFLYRNLGEGEWLMSAKLPLKVASGITGVELSSEEVNTLGGLVIEKLGRVPSEGKPVLLAENLGVVVVDASAQRVKTLRVFKLDSPERREKFEKLLEEWKRKHPGD